MISIWVTANIREEWSERQRFAWVFMIIGVVVEGARCIAPLICLRSLSHLKGRSPDPFNSKARLIGAGHISIL